MISSRFICCFLLRGFCPADYALRFEHWLNAALNAGSAPLQPTCMIATIVSFAGWPGVEVPRQVSAASIWRVDRRSARLRQSHAALPRADRQSREEIKPAQQRCD